MFFGAKFSEVALVLCCVHLCEIFYDVGMISKDFELSSQPNFGDWKISVEVEVYFHALFHL